MGSIVRQVFFIVFLLFAMMGYAYFGPPSYTRYLTSNVLFRKYIGPAIDQMVLSGQKESISVGYLSVGQGDLTFRPSTELVFLPAREGQRFYGGTLVSSGEQSAATITLTDNSQLRLAANSTVFLEPPQGGMEDGVIQLKVIKGTVEAEKTEASSNLKVKLVTPRGRIAKVEGRKLLVVAPVERVDPRKRNPMQVLSDMRPKQEFVGLADEAPAVKEIEKALVEGRQINVVQRREIFDRIDPELEAELNTRPNRQVAALAPATTAGANAIKVVDDNNNNNAAVVAPVAPAAAVAVTPPTPPTPPPAPAPAVVAPPVVKPAVVAATPVAPKPVAKVLPKKLPVRAPAAVEKPAPVAVKAPIEERKAKPRQVVKSFEAPPTGSELSGAMYASKQGDKDTAKRLVASALTKSEYGTSAFNDATRFAVDELMQGYMDSSDCPQAKNTILNVARAYPDNNDAKAWAKKWRDVYRQKCQ